MTNLEKLHEVQRMRNRISKQKELISYYDTMSLSLGGGGFEEKVQCTRNLDAPFVKWIFKKIDAEEQLKVMERHLNEKIEEMTSILDGIEAVDYKMILTYRYLLDKDWVTISDLLHLSLSSVYRYHRKSLEELDALKVDSR